MEPMWHIMQFYPAYNMINQKRTPVSTFRHACEIGLKAGLWYVYQGKVPGEGGENTYCYLCKELLIHHYSFLIRSNRVRDGRCHDCGAASDGVEMNGGQ